MVPGSYTFPIETAIGTSADTRTVNEGDATDLFFVLSVVGAVPSRFTVNLVLNDPRELPDAASSGITSTCERSYTIGGPGSQTLSLKAFSFPNECAYQIAVPGRLVTLSQTADTTINLHRIDVDDVVVTREDNTTFVQRGTYELYYGGALVAGPYPTNTGIDALDGDYEVVVKYTTGTGAKTNRYTIHF